MNVNEALAALKDSMDNRQAVELRGEQGIPGPEGRAGRDGKDAPPVSIRIGAVILTEGEPAARIRADGANAFILDLALPRGQQGEKGLRGLPSEEPGPVGPKGDTPTEEELLRLIRRVVKENQEVLRGPKGDRGAPGEQGPQGVMGLTGDSIEGPRGEAGRSVDEEMLKKILIGVMCDAGVMTEHAQKLIAVRAELRRAVHQADSRHQAQIAEVYRRVDNIIG